MSAMYSNTENLCYIILTCIVSLTLLSPGSSPPKPDIFVNDTALNVVDKFCYLGSVLAQNADINDEITRRIGAASAAFGRLETRL